MSDQDNVFNQGEGDKPAEGTTQTATQDNEFIGEGKKYATEADALASVPHAQAHIDKLEAEKAELLEDLNKRQTAEELLDKMREAGRTSDTPSESVDLEALVDKRLAVKEQADRKAANISKADKAYKEKWGEKSGEALALQAQELGMSVSAMQEVAANSPSAFMKMVGLETTNTGTAHKPMESSVNTEQLAGSGVKHGTYAYYNALRKSDPSKYHSRAVTLERHNQAQKLGAKFFD